MLLACATCERCRSGLSTHCAGLGVLGLVGSAGATVRDGVFAEEIVVPVTALEKVPAKVPDEVAAIANTVAGVLHAARFVRIESKPYVTVLGDGAVGLLMAQHLVRANASVRLLGLHSERFALCERWGIKHRDVREVGLRQDQDVVVDCTGSAAGLETALRLVRPRGKVVLKSPPVMGARGASYRPNLAHGLAGEVELVCAGHGSLHDALGLLARGELDVVPLLTRRGTLAQVPAALASAEGHGALRVVVDAG